MPNRLRVFLGHLRQEFIIGLVIEMQIHGAVELVVALVERLRQPVNA
jgi:hypothetical protein